MKKNTDRVSEAYYYELGEEFGKKVRDRVHWILESSQGETVLDVGCSQGLTSILLAREGKDVVGIDVLEDAIEYARNQLEQEEKPTREHLELIHDNFASHSFDRTFDVIIMGEILEHIADTNRFIHKAIELLNPNGRLIITVPFGINDYFDHKHTYYLHDILNFQTSDLHLTEIKFLNGWIGASFEKNASLVNLHVDEKLIREFELALVEHERRYLKQIHALRKAKETAESNTENEYLQEKMEKVKVQKELYDQYQAEEQLLRKYDNLEEQYHSLKMKYDNLRKSKLGKLTTKYWKWRRKRSN